MREVVSHDMQRHGGIVRVQPPSVRPSRRAARRNGACAGFQASHGVLKKAVVEGSRNERAAVNTVAPE